MIAKVLGPLLLSSLAITPAFARAHSYGRVHYSGSHHSASHGGHYSGGRRSSHRGGHYVNTRTGNHYGCHRC